MCIRDRPTSASITGGPAVYTVTVTGMSVAGAVTLSVPAGAAQDAALLDNEASPAPAIVQWELPSATQLAYVQQPTDAAAEATIVPAVTVQLQDAGANPVAIAGTTITLTLTSGNGTLSGTASRVTNASGLATFDDLSIDLAGSKVLTAASAGLTSAVSSSFTITAGPAASIVVTGGSPQFAVFGAAFPSPLLVTVTDSAGNPVSGVTVTFLAPASGPSAILSNGGIATTNASGRASVTATANGMPGGPYIVTASVGQLTAAEFSLTNLAAAASATIPTLDHVGLVALALLLAAAGTLALRGAFKV